MFQEITVDALCERIIDYRGKTPEKSSSGVRLITAKVVKGGKIHSEPAEYIPTENYDAWMRRGLPQQWDVLITTEAPLGEVAILLTDAKVALGQRLILLRGKRGTVDQRFLLYVLQSPTMQARLAARATGTTVAGIKQSELRKVLVPVPPLATQRRIASILSAYDDLIENNERRITILEDMARRMFREWFVEFRFPGHEAVPMVDTQDGRFPEGWRRAPIKEAFDDLFDGPHATPAPASEGPIFLGIGNITKSGRLDLAEVRHIAEEDFGRWTKRVQPAEGDIVFTYEATLNRYALIPRGFRGCLGRRLALIRTNSVPGMNIYLYLLFFTEGWRQLIARNTLSGSTVDRIPLTRFPDFPIILPQHETLAAFDALVRPMIDHMGCLSEATARLAAARDLLLPRLISGELSVEAADRVMEAAE